VIEPVLERAALVQKRANGRQQRVSTDHARLRREAELLDSFDAKDGDDNADDENDQTVRRHVEFGPSRSTQG
jgi:hypothetical protein